MASTNTDSTLEIRLDSMRTATVGDLTMFHPKDSHGPSALESEQISSEYVSEINFSRKHHQAPFSLENINSHQRQRIHRPLSTYTSLGSPLRPVGSGRLRSVSLGNVNTCLQSRSVPNSPGQFHHEQRPYQQGYYGGPSAFGGLLIPQPSPSSNKDDDGMDTTSDAADVIPPELSDQRKAMEAACAAERVRAKQREMEEQNMTADELRMVLKKERLRTGKIKSDLVALRYGAVQNQLQAEVLEEGRINGLMRRMDLLQEEKGRILLELEREEEMLTNTLQRKLDEVRREKLLLENQIESEKKSHQMLESELDELRQNSSRSEAQPPQKTIAKAEALEEEEEEMEEED